jgi:hypothetical protein
MTVLVHLVNLSNGIHLCLHQVSCITSGLSLSRMSKILSLGDVLAVKKRRFHTPTCQVYARNNYVNTLSTNQVPRF